MKNLNLLIGLSVVSFSVPGLLNAKNPRDVYPSSINNGIKHTAYVSQGMASQDDMSASVKENEYLLIGKSMFDNEGNNLFGSGGFPIANSVYIDFDDETGKVTFSNLFRNVVFGDQIPFDLNWNNDTRIISAFTPVEFESIEECVLVGEGDDCIAALIAGNPYGIGYWKALDQIVMTVSKDKNIIFPQSGFALAQEYYDDWFECYDCYAYYDAVYDAALYKRAEGIAIYTNVESIDFGKTFINTTAKGTFRVVNAGTEQADFVLSSTDPAFTTSITSGFLTPGEYIDIEVNFLPTITGEINGELLLETDETSVSVAVSGLSRNSIDYSPIVSSGYEYMVFSTGNEYPFEIDTELTGFPVAISTNMGEGLTSSWLEVQITVPENQTGLLKWEGFFNPRWAVYDVFIVTDNGESVYETPSDTQYKMEIGSEFTLESGSHTLRFSYDKDVIVNPQSVQLGEDYTYISNISYSEITGIRELITKEIVKRTFFTTDGVEVNEPAKGIYIVQDVMKDGSVVVHKAIFR
ncbi:MAG: hypothetical protein K2H75_01560 [Muribaculaceae bacterium]|nr:hypothetical protein [Muribaculaceae bacterium]